MSKWKCDICKKEFDNFHAQGFDGKIHCPLCFFKEENRRLKDKINTYEHPENLTLMFMYCDEKAKDKINQLKEVIEEVREYIEKNLSFCENDSQGIYEKCNIRIASDRKLLQILDRAKEI